MPQQFTESKVTANVVIVGGGVIGLAIARALSLRGARDVVVLERNEFGREASWAAGGILAPQVEADASDDFLKLACASRDLYPKFVGELLTESATDIELDTTGTLYVAFTEAEEREFRARFDWQRSEGLSIEWLTGEETRKLEPRLSRNLRCALRFPNDYQVENRRLVEALIISNRQLRTQLFDQVAVKSVCADGDRIIGVETSRGFISCAAAVIAAGAWSSSISVTQTVDLQQPTNEAPRSLRYRLEVEPVRGQMLCFHAGPTFVQHVVYGSRGYLIPRHDGRLLAGSTSERVGFDKSVTAAGCDSIKLMAAEIAPEVAGLELLDSWSGFRPHARGEAPVLGMSPDIDGLFYATGHYRNGILLAPITGELLADAIISGEVSPLLAPFSPANLNTFL